VAETAVAEPAAIKYRAFVGDVLVAQDDLQAALKNFRDALAIAERLAKADLGNAQWQADVLWWNWRLAKYGDDPARRWALIVPACAS
jgi:hypothetical protein